MFSWSSLEVHNRIDSGKIGNASPLEHEKRVLVEHAKRHDLVAVSRLDRKHLVDPVPFREVKDVARQDVVPAFKCPDPSAGAQDPARCPGDVVAHFRIRHLDKSALIPAPA